ncbi:hypothetical protein J6590_039146 [Homalodisca vitripennis]|nr:hypothetical protein J6590_039146 [Homalodisca vitripennis]
MSQCASKIQERRAAEKADCATSSVIRVSAGSSIYLCKGMSGTLASEEITHSTPFLHCRFTERWSDLGARPSEAASVTYSF